MGIKKLQKIVVDMIKKAGSGHYASSMSALEIMYPLFYEQGIKPDEFILSKGHAAPALYAILYDLGYIKSLDGFREYGGLPGHPELGIPGVLCSSGSLGMGISKAIGLATANPEKTYHVLVGDGEFQEGQNWEALSFLVTRQVTNLHVWIDKNLQQYSGKLNGSWLPDTWGTIHLVETTWQKDNHYLTKSKPDPVITGYSHTLLKMMAKYHQIVVLDADLEQDFGLTPIKEAYPGRFIECGISEQHMVSMANGLALAGKIPFVHTFGAFYRRVVDQVYNNNSDGLHIIYVAGLMTKPKANIGVSHNPGCIKDIMQMLGCVGYNRLSEALVKDSMPVFLSLEGDDDC